MDRQSIIEKMGIYRMLIKEYERDAENKKITDENTIYELRKIQHTLKINQKNAVKDRQQKLQKEWRARNIERVKQLQKEWAKTNKERLREYKKRWRQNRKPKADDAV